MLSHEELGSLCGRFKISTSLRIRGNVSRLSILISISWKRKAKVNTYLESTRNSTLWEKNTLLMSCYIRRALDWEVVLPARVVGGGGPGPGGQRRARHQDHPVEQHPWHGGHYQFRA